MPSSVLNPGHGTCKVTLSVGCYYTHLAEEETGSERVQPQERAAVRVTEQAVKAGSDSPLCLNHYMISKLCSRSLFLIYSGKSVSGPTAPPV